MHLSVLSSVLRCAFRFFFSISISVLLWFGEWRGHARSKRQRRMEHVSSMFSYLMCSLGFWAFLFPFADCWCLFLCVLWCRVVKEEKGFFPEINSYSQVESEVSWYILWFQLLCVSCLFRFSMCCLVMCVFHQIAYSCWSLQVRIILIWMSCRCFAPMYIHDHLVNSDG